MYESVLKSVSLYNILLLINTKVFEVIYVLVTSAVIETLLCLWVHKMPQLCNCQVQWHVLSKPWQQCRESLEEKLRESLSTVLAGVRSQRAWGGPGAAPWPCKAFLWLWDVLAFKLWYLAEGAASVGHLKPSVGLDFLAFGTAGFSDHEAAQALPLTWLLPLFSCSRSLCWSLIIKLFSVELSNLFLAASEESYSSYWFVVLRILTRVSVFVLVFLLLFPVMWIPSLDLCTMVLIYLVTILYWEGIFKNCDFSWIFLPFDFFSYLK